MWHLRRISLEEKMSSVGERHFDTLMWADFLMEFFFFEGDCDEDDWVNNGSSGGRAGCSGG